MSDLIRVHGTGKHEDDYITFGIEPKRILRDYDMYERFIKGCEHTVRKDDRYIAYIAKLKSAGLTHCAILGNIQEDDKVSLEMHHGPIFNLFDICDIVAKSMIKRGRIHDLTTFDIGDLVLTEHELDNIMIVMLSKTPHKGNHNNGRGIFINIKATFGRLDRFLDRYHDGMEEEHHDYIARYIAECKKAKGSIDNGLFDTAEQLRSFK